MTTTPLPLTTRERYMAVLRLGAPILVSQVGLIVVGFADSAMVGHYSTDALASASFVNNVFNIVMLMCLGFSYGLTPIVGGLYTSGKRDDIRQVLRKGVVVNVAWSLLLCGVMGVLYFYLDRLGQPSHLLPQIRPYFLIYLASVPSMSLFQAYAQTSYAMNSSKMPMWIVLGCNALNILGNYALIYGELGMPEMGLTGAGIATFVSRWAGAIVIVLVMRRQWQKGAKGLKGENVSKVEQEQKGLKGWLRALMPTGGEVSFKRLIKTSLPVSVQMGLETSAFSVSAVMAGWLGATELAAYQVFVTVGTLGFCVYYGMGAAVAVLVANASSLGAEAKKQMRAIAKSGYVIILCLTGLACVVFVLFGELLVSVFTEDEQVVAMVLSLIPPLLLYQLGDATQVNFSNALRGTGNVVPMMWIALVAYVLIGIPSTYLLAFTFEMGIIGIALSFSVSLFLAGGLFIWAFRRATWQ